MTEATCPEHLFDYPAGGFEFSNAVAAIITDPTGRYLMQLRDDKVGVFYPGHWGLFGGAIDDGESDEEAFLRELKEELDYVPRSYCPFNRVSFDAGGLHADSQKTRYYRQFFTVEITLENISEMTLGEGRRMKLFDLPSLLPSHSVAPYDAYALWLHYSDAVGGVAPV